MRCHCGAPAVVVEQELRPAVTIRLNGKIERWERWVTVARFCEEHA